MKIYIAGPMRGIDLYNFPAFDACAERLRTMGHEPVNPADLDRESGVTEWTDPLPEDFMRGAMKRDLLAIIDGCEGIALLPGWEKSSGVAAELALAKCLGLSVLDAHTLEPMDATILDEAKRLTRGDRNDDYGHPYDDFSKVARLWSVILGVEVKPSDIPLCMIQIKVARQMNRPKRDNWTDIAGYADTGHRVDERGGDAANG